MNNIPTKIRKRGKIFENFRLRFYLRPLMISQREKMKKKKERNGADNDITKSGKKFPKKEQSLMLKCVRR